MSATTKPDAVATEQPVFCLLVKRKELMPDGSLGAVYIGEFGEADRSKDLRLTLAQARTLAKQIQERL